MTRMSLKTSQKIALLGSLYIAQGVPFGFFTQAFPSLMRKQGYSLESISLATLLALPWAVKFLWAPAVDRFGFKRFGRRKSWLVPLQIGTTLSLLAIAFLAVEGASLVIIAAVFTVNLMIASQDIATDALAVDIINQKERGMANGVQVAGYRMGMVVGGGLFLMIYDWFGWSPTFTSMALLTMATTIPVLAYRETPHLIEAMPKGTGVKSFLKRPGILHAVTLIAIYKFGEGFASGMVRPFLVDRGVSLTDIAAMLGIVGFSAILVGGLVGGATVNILGRRNALVAFGVLQSLTIAGYVYLSLNPTGQTSVYFVCGAENFASGMANAALFTCMMDWSNKRTGATDYTVQASIVVIASGLATTLSGFSASVVGYTAHFILAFFLAVGAPGAVLFLYRMTPRRASTRETHVLIQEDPCLDYKSA